MKPPEGKANLSWIEEILAATAVVALLIASLIALLPRTSGVFADLGNRGPSVAFLYAASVLTSHRVLIFFMTLLGIASSAAFLRTKMFNHKRFVILTGSLLFASAASVLFVSIQMTSSSDLVK